MDEIRQPPAPDWLTPGDVNSLVSGLWPLGTRRDEQGQLVVAGHRIEDLLGEFGSPLYVMDELDFRRRAREFAQAFTGWEVFYAGKSFLCRAVARWVAEEGLNLDVCSGNELAVALSAGFPAERIGLHGNNKSVDELSYAIGCGVGRIIVDSLAEIDRIEQIGSEQGSTVNVLVRATTGVTAHTHDNIITSHEDQKFGFSIASGQALEALLACQQRPHIHLAGVHFHIGSQILDLEPYAEAIRRAIGLISQFRTITATELTDLDVGGGYGIAYTAADLPPDPEMIHRELTTVIDQACAEYGLGELRLSIEPGRAICGPAGVALYTVGTIKSVEMGQGQRLYVAVDGGMSDNVRTAMYQADYSAVLANRSSSSSPRLARVVGKHCESGDILVRDVYLPDDLAIGDVLAVPGAGAYARSLASNYNHALRPAVVAASPGQARPILRRETLDDLLALDLG